MDVKKEEPGRRDDTLLGYEVVGSGPNFVMVFNDWLADCSSWKPMHSYLDGESFTYAFVDLRGYGRSKDLTGAHSAEEAARDAFRLASHLGWKKFSIVGFSMTGMVVERMVLDHPDRIVSEIAVGPVSAAGVAMSARDKAMFLETLTDDGAVRELASRITGGKLSKGWLNQKLMLERTTRNRTAPPDYLEMWTNPEFAFADEVRAVRPTVPLLVVVGEWDDEAFREKKMQETFLAWHDNAEMVVIRNCGHCPMQETPVYMATLIEHFVVKSGTTT